LREGKEIHLAGDIHGKSFNGVLIPSGTLYGLAHIRRGRFLPGRCEGLCVVGDEVFVDPVRFVAGNPQAAKAFLDILDECAGLRGRGRPRLGDRTGHRRCDAGCRSGKRRRTGRFVRAARGHRARCE